MDIYALFQHLVDKDPGLMGNLLVQRLVGAHIDLVSEEEYAQIGSEVRTLYMWTPETPRFELLVLFTCAPQKPCISSQSCICSNEMLFYYLFMPN